MPKDDLKRADIEEMVDALDRANPRWRCPWCPGYFYVSPGQEDPRCPEHGVKLLKVAERRKR